MGKDKKLQTGSRYILCAKIARIHGKKESGKELTELFVETSQSKYVKSQLRWESINKVAELQNIAGCIQDSQKSWEILATVGLRMKSTLAVFHKKPSIF